MIERPVWQSTPCEAALGRMMSFFDMRHQAILIAQVFRGQFTFVGEVALTLWLLIKGVNVQRWQAIKRLESTLSHAH